MQLMFTFGNVRVYFVPRSEWGSTQDTEDFIRNRSKQYVDKVTEKTTIQIHHTAAIDIDDNTPNFWDYDEAVAYMRKLQWSRLSDLGPLPYSENVAISEDGRTVWLFEGRGIMVRGAHTAGHNEDGVGWGIFGNFDKPTLTGHMQTILRAIELRVGMLRRLGLVNLGTELSPRGWVAWGHRDTAAKSCPGNNLYPLLSSFKLEEGDNMLLTQYLDREAWVALIDAGLTPGPIESVEKYWITEGFLRPLGEHVNSSNDLIRDIALAIKALKTQAVGLQRGDSVKLV